MHIAQALGSGVWGDVDDTSLERGIGGREGALIRLSREWAKLGHNVTNYVMTQKPSKIWEGDHYYEFVPFKMIKPCLASFQYDAVVAWECPSVYSDERIIDRQHVRLVEMQCAHFPAFEQEASNEFSTGVVGLSKWHTDFISYTGAKGPFYIMPNGVDLEHYPTPGDPEVKRNRNRQFFYSSSPDRGLWHLLQIWPDILKEWPNATLKVAYGATKWIEANRWHHNRVGHMATEMIGLMGQQGIEDIGVVPQSHLAQVQRNSVAWAYPCDTMGPTETGCITAIEAMAAGCPVITTNADCMQEEFRDVSAIVKLPFDKDFFTGIKTVIENKELYAALAGMGREFAEKRQWRLIAPGWIDLFEEQISHH